MRRVAVFLVVLMFLVPGCWRSFGIGSENDSDSETDGVYYCTESFWEMERDAINILLIVDQSSSMYNFTMDGQTYASVVADALSQTVETYDNADLINFGLTIFPNPGSFWDSSGPWEDDFCVPATDHENPVVTLGPDNTSDIQWTLSINPNSDYLYTPTCHTLIWAESYLAGDNIPADIAGLPTSVLLATDGAPNCNYDLNPNTCVSTAWSNEPATYSFQCLDDTCTYDAAKALSDAGFPVYVLGVGSQAYEWEDVLNGIADQGGTGESYPAGSVEALESALDEITSGAVACTYNLDWDKVPEVLDDHSVIRSCDSLTLFGTSWFGADTKIEYMLDCDDENPGTETYGWNWQGLDVPPEKMGDESLENCSIVELCPEACNKLKVTADGWESVTAKFLCTANP